MANFIDRIISVLPEYQRNSIKALIAAKAAAGELSSIRARQQEASSIYNRIKGKLTKTLLSPKYAVKGAKISSEDYNANMEEIYMDLNTLYTSINNIYLATKDQIVSLDNDYFKSRSTIEKLINDVKVFSERKLNPQFNEIKVIDFNSTGNRSKQEPAATVSSNVRLLELKPLMTNRAHLTNRTSRNTKIYTKTYSQGLKGELAASFPTENIVDQKTDTFWGTVILADGPVSQVYQKNTSTGSNFQVAVEGPVVEVYFKFSHTEKINTIKILPFAEYPVRIIDVSYRPSSSSQVLIPIDSFQETSTLDWVELNFLPVLANEVRITIAQENYKKVSYLLPKSVVTNTDIFQRILKLKASKVIGKSVFDSDFSLYLLNTINAYEGAINALQKLYKDYSVDFTIQPNLEFYNDIESILQLAYQELSPVEITNLTKYHTSEEVNQQPGDTVVNVTKYEYMLGLREVEINHQFYYPTSFYESEEFLPQATVSEIQIEVDEHHVDISTPWQDDYHKTSTEWEIDIGGGRKLPIHPVNIVDDVTNIPSVKDERIDFNFSTNEAYTRLGGYYSSVYRLKKNGDVIPPDLFQSERTTGSIPKIKITLTGEYFDVNSIYTVDYAVDPSSYNLDILNKFDSETITSPEIYTEVGSDNEITLSKFPFINYEVINLTGFFKKESTSKWNFVSPQEDVFSGQAYITPTIIDNVGNIIQEGSITGQIVTGLWGEQSGIAPAALSGNPDLSLSYFGDIRGVEFGYYIKVMDSSIYGSIDRFQSASTFILDTPIVVSEDQVRRWDTLASGVVFSGAYAPTMSGQLTVDYRLGVGVNSDNNIYTISDINYTPLTVYVAGKEAKNITDYETLVHPAFSISSRNDNEIEYIQAGKKLYFNQNITGKEIRVYYNWLTEYIKVIGTLKFNGPINPNLTPKVNEIRVYINNLII